MAIRIDPSVRTRGNKVAEAYTKTWMRGVTWGIERHARKMVRSRTGQTRSKTYTVAPWRAGRNVRGVVRCDSRIAVIEDRGTPPHVIAQRRGGPPLTFYWPKVGHWVRFARVNHPGTAGSRFLTGALVMAADEQGMEVKVNLV